MAHADLRSAHLQGANLRRAILRDADLREANLTSAILHEADLTDAEVDDTTIWPADHPVLVTSTRRKPLPRLGPGIPVHKPKHPNRPATYSGTWVRPPSSRPSQFLDPRVLHGGSRWILGTELTAWRVADTRCPPT
jgi:hypothetical protein